MRNYNFRLSGPQVPESCCKNPLDPQQRKACIRDKLEERYVFMDVCIIMIELNQDLIDLN